MEIRHFKTLKAIIEEGSFIKAAKVLNYAQSSVTSHIQAIEEFYAQPVFDRMNKRFVLNSFGKKLYKHSLKLLETYDLIMDLKSDSKIPSGQIRIGAPESTIQYRLYPILKQYKELYPDVRLIMSNASSSKMRSALSNGTLDIALLLEQKRSISDIHLEKLIEEPMSIVIPTDYPENNITPDLYHTLLYTEKGCSYRTIFENLISTQGIETDNIIETTNVEVIKQYIRCGMGISFLPTITVQKEIESGQIRHIPWNDENPVILQIAYHTNKWLSPAISEFIRLINEESKHW